MIYSNVVYEKIENIILSLEDVKYLSLEKHKVLLNKSHTDILLELVKKEEQTFLSLFSKMKELNSFIKMTPFSNLKELIDSCENQELLSKYEYLIFLENEIQDINDYNFDIVSECLKINNHYLNLLHPQEDTGYNLDNQLINKKLKILNSVY